MNESSSGAYLFADHNDFSHVVSPLLCYTPTMIAMGGIWRGDNPLDFSFPLFLFQLVLIVATTRFTAAILRPFRLPRYVSEVAGGLLLGPSVLGRIPQFDVQIFPLRSVVILETMANVGLIYFIFILGLEIDRSAVHRTGQSYAFAATCIAIPLLACSLAGFIFRPKLHMPFYSATSFLMFLCVTLMITAFSVLARSLAELKLLNTTLGTTALSCSMLVDLCAWGLLVVAISLSQNKGKLQATIFTLLSGFVLYMAILLVCKPAVRRVMNRTPEGEEVHDFYCCVMLVAVLAAAFVSDLIGLHSMTGPLMLGLAMPKGALAEALVERVEDFVEGVLLPLFFATSGLKTNFFSMKSLGALGFMLAMVVAGTVAKVGGCLVVGRLYDMKLREGVAMGLLMNTRGVIEIVVLNIGRDRQLLSEEAFTTLVFLSMVVAAVSYPLLCYLTRPTSRRLSSYTRRIVEWPPDTDEHLRVLFCVHFTRHVPTSLALLDSLNPTRRSPVSAFALQLIELTSRASAMLIVNTTTTKEAYAANPLGFSLNNRTMSGNSSIADGSSHSSHRAAARPSTSRVHSDHIMRAFITYGQHTIGASVHPLNAVSPYDTMHLDVCGVAEENQAALIVLPFHKLHTVDGGLEPINPGLRILNQNVLGSAPCSVAILVDRGLRPASRLPGGSARHHVTLLFLGGPDDREAMAIASRMVEHPGIALTVVRFVPATVDSDDTAEKELDDDCIGKFRQRHGNCSSVAFREKVVSNGEETMEAIKGTLEEVSDLFIVGRGTETGTALTKGLLTDWSECPELGLIGDLLASADFGATVSVLVVQQCREKAAKVFEVVPSVHDTNGTVANDRICT